jgi:predicted nucleotidyltransferase
MEGLNEKLWSKDGTVIPIVREKLLRIAKKFLDDFITPIKVKNIYLVGSLASYKWSSTSDIDVHITVDIKENHSYESTVDYFDLKKDVFNKTHNIFIKGYKVEINIREDEAERSEFYKDKPIYDLYNQEWINLPNKNTRNLNDPLVLELSNYFESKIKKLIKDNASSEDFKVLKATIKALRKQGLKHDGEYSIGNLIFKHLRNSGANKRLFDYKNELEDKELSLERFADRF